MSYTVTAGAFSLVMRKQTQTHIINAENEFYCQNIDVYSHPNI